MARNIYEYLMTISRLLLALFSDKKSKNKNPDVQLKHKRSQAKKNYVAAILFGKVILYFREHTEFLHC